MSSTPQPAEQLFWPLFMLLCGFGVIAMELNKPFSLMLYAVISPNFESPIWWMGALYGAYLVVLVVEFYFCMQSNQRGAFYSGLLGFLLAIAALSNSGGVFGLLSARTFWSGVFSPLYLVVTALISGTALMVMEHYLKIRCREQQFSRRDSSYMNLLGQILALCLFLYTLSEKVFDLEARHVHLRETDAVEALKIDGVGVNR